MCVCLCVRVYVRAHVFWCVDVYIYICVCEYGCVWVGVYRYITNSQIELKLAGRRIAKEVQTLI